MFNILYKKYFIILNMDETNLKEMIEKVKRQTTLTDEGDIK